MRVTSESWQDLGIKVQSILEFTTRGYSTIGLSIVMRVAKVFVESWDQSLINFEIYCSLVL